MRPRLIFLFCVPVATGCASLSGGDDGPVDTEPPVLEILTPERGTILDGHRVVVSGTVTDDVAVDSVIVSGVAAAVDPDGSFRAEVEIEDGISVLETVARDRQGNESRDRRAVMTGTFSGQGTPISQALVARVTREAFAALGDLAGGVVDQTDLTGLAAQANPIYKSGGSCLGVTVDVQSIEYRESSVEMAPHTGGMDVVAEFHDFHVRLRARYKVACIGGSSTVTIDARVLRIASDADLGIEGEQIAFSMGDPGIGFEDFRWNVSGLPNSIVSMFVNVEREVASAIYATIKDMLPAMVGGFLAEVDGQALSLQVLGVATDLRIKPTEIDFDEDGATLAAEIAVTFPQLAEADFLRTPADSPLSQLLDLQRGFRVGLADEVANQLLAGFWAARALDFAREIPEGDAAQVFLGDEVARTAFTVLLPPMMQMDPGRGVSRVTFGDVVVDVEDAQGGLLYRFVVSGALDVRVSLTADLRLTIETSSPDLWVSILESNGPAVLTEDQLSALAEVSIRDLAKLIDESLKTLPIPAFADLSLVDPAILGARGYVVLGADFAAAAP